MTPQDLKDWRSKVGFSQRQLAERLGMATGAVSHWEISNRPIPVWLPLALAGIEQEIGHA